VVKKLIETIRSQYGLDLSEYALPFLKTVLETRYLATASSGPSDYLKAFKENPKELIKLKDALTITYTCFFRNELEFTLLDNVVLPEILNRKSKKLSNNLRIWSAGCSDGAEPYSIALIVHKLIHERRLGVSAMIFGTDSSEAIIEKAHQGVFNATALDKVRKAFLDQYFTRSESHFSLSDQICKMVDFSVGNITDPFYLSPPAAIFADFDLIFCSNLLIYYSPQVQKKILEKLYKALAYNGYLVVDASERLIVEQTGLFKQLYPVGSLFSRC